MPNFVRDFLAAQPPATRALVTLDRQGRRREWTFRELDTAAGSFAAAFAARGLRRGDVLLTVLGNRIEYALTMLACLRLGAALLPCSEQLRAKDLALRLGQARPALVVCAGEHRDTVAAADPDCPVLTVPDPQLWRSGPPPPAADLGPTDPAFVLFTSGTSGAPKQVTHGQRYVWGQRLQAEHWLAARPGELVWSTAAPGWSKSTRNGFLAPWLTGAAALLQERRFDAAERLATVRAEGVTVLCMAPTEYRLIAEAGPLPALPTVRRMVTAGEPLGEPVLARWRSATGLVIADGYGQTETGHLVGVRPGEQAPPGSMGRPLPGVRVELAGDELTVDPDTVPSFFLGYDGRPAPTGMWRTGDRVHRDTDGWLYFLSRVDDVILSAGYRIGPAEVEAALLTHPAVREAAVIGVPDPVRGEVVAAAVVLRDGHPPGEALARALQEHVKAETAPYKYPRRVAFLPALPHTTSGKIARGQLRAARLWG